MRLDRHTIHRDNIGLGLQKTPGLLINAKLRAESFKTIPTQCRQTTACTISECTNPKWCQETIHNARIESTSIRQKNKRFIQQVCGKFLFLGRAIDSTLLCLISAIASQSSKPTEGTMRQTLQLLNHLAMQEDAILSYLSSTQQRQLLKQAKSRKPGGRALLPFKRYHCPTKQLEDTEHSTYHKERYAISH